MSSESDFIPKRRLITGITNEENPTVTTSEDHEYYVGDIVRIVVPRSYGMDIDYEDAEILTTPTTDTFTIDLDTTALETFVVPVAPYTEAHVVPIAGQVTDNIAS